MSTRRSLPGEPDDRHLDDYRIEARLDASLAERVETFRDEHGKGKSEVLREALEEYLPESEDAVDAPADPELRETYLWLRERTDEYGKIPGRMAISDLAQKFQKKEKYIKRSRLDPLRSKNWIEPKGGQIYVRGAADGD